MQAYMGGRMSMTWQLPKPFLEGCRVEVCSKPNSGTCKHTGHKFAKVSIFLPAYISGSEQPAGGSKSRKQI